MRRDERLSERFSGACVVSVENKFIRATTSKNGDMCLNPISAFYVTYVQPNTLEIAPREFGNLDTSSKEIDRPVIEAFESLL